MKVAADAGAGAAPADSSSPSAIAAPDAALGAKPAAHAGKDSGSKGVTAPLVKVADKYAAPGTPGSSAYKIGPQDVLEISVFKVPELARSVQVADAGTINLPLVGEVQAAGRTASELERDLAKKLGVQVPAVAAGHRLREGIQQPPRDDRGRRQEARRLSDPRQDHADAVHRHRGGPDRGRRHRQHRRLPHRRRQALGGASSTSTQIREGKAEDPVIEEGDVIVVNESATKAAFQNLLKAMPITSAFVPLL